MWLILSIVMILIATNWIWTLLGGPTQKRWIASVIAFTFFPTIIVLRMGQIGPVLLLGIAGFLHFERKQRYWLAGAFAALLAIKPHLLYLVCISILVWSIGRRRWGILGGGALILLSATLTAVMFNPNVITQYLSATDAKSPLVWMTPTLGSLLRWLLGFERKWLAFIPMAAAYFWLGLYGFRHRADWLMGGSDTVAASRLGGYSPPSVGHSIRYADSCVAAADGPVIYCDPRTIRVRHDRLLSGHQHRGIRRGICHSCPWPFLRLLATVVAPVLLIWYLLAQRWSRHAAARLPV